MKRILIEQVDNGYIVTNKPERDDRDAVCVSDVSGVHVFESFSSLSNWLNAYFTGDWEDKAIMSVHLGLDET